MAATEDYEEDYEEYYDEEGGVSGFVVLVVGIVVLIVFFAVLAFTYQRGIQKGSALPVVSASAEPIKTEQEVSFNTQSTTAQEVQETLSAPPQSQVVVDTSEEEDPLANFEQTASATENQASSDAGTGVDTTSVTEQPTVSQPEPEVVVQEPVVDTTPPVEENRPDPVVTQPVPTATQLSSATDGTHVVQVGAFRSNEEALGKFSSMQDKLSAIIGGKQPDVQRADLGDRGIYYRLRVGPFSNKQDAVSFCNQLKANGQDCLVKSVS